MQDEHQVNEEDRLRQALARLGAGQSDRNKNKQRTITTPRVAPVSAERRRRFVRDGQVVVEHQGGRGIGARTPVQDDQDEIERLRQSVKREQRRWEEAEQSLGELRAQIKAFETREAHAKIQIGELNRELREQRDMIQTLKASVHQAREQAAEAARRSPRPVGRPRKEVVPCVETSAIAVAEDMVADIETGEPEPVQWWVKA